MADYIYLLESRLSKVQQHALNVLREIARERGLTIFLVGGAVRDLTSGSPVRDLDVVVQGNALKLKKDIEKAGGIVSGEYEPGQALFLRFPGSVRLELGSTVSINYPKPGKPVAKPATILDDLRRRDFTANAMALSLNAGSYGLLMDPLNGVADIENRELRLVSNYGFIEDPVRMVRAARLMARLGWQMDEKTAARYETGKQEGYISAASSFSRGYEAEEIVHEEDPLRVLRRLESEGWLNEIAPGWSSTKANEAELERLRENQTKLQLQGIHPSPAAANFPLLTARMSPTEVASLKQAFPRLGFVREIEMLDSEAKDLAAQLTSKSAALPSQTWKLLHAAKPEAVLQVAFSSKSAAIQAKFKNFFTEWPQARQKVPYTLMQEMRIVPELPGYEEFVDSVMFEIMDGKLTSPEEMKAFLEPFSPPAPPPPVNLRRARASKKEGKGTKGRGKKSSAVEDADLEPQPLANQGSDADFDPDAESAAPDPDSSDLDSPDLDSPDLDLDVPALDLQSPAVDLEALDLDLDVPQLGLDAPGEDSEEVDNDEPDAAADAVPTELSVPAKAQARPAPSSARSAPKPLAAKKSPAPGAAAGKPSASAAAKSHPAPKSLGVSKVEAPPKTTKKSAPSKSEPVKKLPSQTSPRVAASKPASSAPARHKSGSKSAAKSVSSVKSGVVARPATKSPAKTAPKPNPRSQPSASLKAAVKAPAKPAANKQAAAKPPFKAAKGKLAQPVKPANKRR